MRISPGSQSWPDALATLLTDTEKACGQIRAEVFEQGALSWPDGGIVLNRQHQRGSPIMRVIPSVVGQAVVIDAPLPDTSAGRDTAAEVRAGVFSGLSVEFKATKERFEGGVRRIGAAMLRAAAVVDSPSYAGSAVEVRAGSDIRKDRNGTEASMAVTLVQLRAAIEIETDASTDEALQRMLDTAAALAERYASGAPVAVKDGATIRTVGWMANHPSFSLKGSSAVGVRRSYDTEQLSALRHSGAMALLSPWKIRRAGVI